MGPSAPRLVEKLRGAAAAVVLWLSACDATGHWQAEFERRRPELERLAGEMQGCYGLRYLQIGDRERAMWHFINDVVIVDDSDMECLDCEQTHQHLGAYLVRAGIASDCYQSILAQMRALDVWVIRKRRDPTPPICLHPESAEVELTIAGSTCGLRCFGDDHNFAYVYDATGNLADFRDEVTEDVRRLGSNWFLKIKRRF